MGKGVARLEQRLGVRLFHRDTHNMTLTEEGRLFLDRCRRIFEEVEAAKMELTNTAVVPSGRLRVSLPLAGMFLMSIIGEFIEAYPAILLELDFSDRLVDVIEEKVRRCDPYGRLERQRSDAPKFWPVHGPACGVSRVSGESGHADSSGGSAGPRLPAPTLAGYREAP